MLSNTAQPIFKLFLSGMTSLFSWDYALQFVGGAEGTRESDVPAALIIIVPVRSDELHRGWCARNEEEFQTKSIR